MYLIFALVAFSILIIIHELGHFTLAKLNGICVEEFAIGMGPKLFGFKGKETEYNIRILPFGGFVRMLGEDGGAIKDKRAFNAKKPFQKILVIGAGATMNYILALVIFAVIALNFGFSKPVISEVALNSPAQNAGLMTGDRLLKVDNSRINTAGDLKIGIVLAKGEAITLEIERNGERLIKEVQPMIDEAGSTVIGITHEFVEKPTLIEGIAQGFKETLTMISQTFKSLKMMVTGEANFKTDVGGPVTIVKMSSQAAKAGIWSLMNFTAFMSVQLAVFNLLPFPALDGGLILIQVLEVITRKKIPEKFIGVINSVGFALLMMLMVVVTLKDIIFPVL
ncbi:MAG: RIP metalloprotease RseP [Clostridium perfringens]|nr:RIP metalloprotease RseP [Clostridium perfringens]